MAVVHHQDRRRRLFLLCVIPRTAFDVCGYSDSRVGSAQTASVVISTASDRRRTPESPIANLHQVVQVAVFLGACRRTFCVDEVCGEMRKKDRSCWTAALQHNEPRALMPGCLKCCGGLTACSPVHELALIGSAWKTASRVLKPYSELGLRHAILQHASAALPAYLQPKLCSVADHQAEAEAAGHASCTEESTV